MSDLTMLEVRLNEPDDFLKIKETLTRIGIQSNPSKGNILSQSCHILYKQGRYFIVHFKELFILDGKRNNLQESDIQRRNTISTLLSDWGLLTISDESVSQDRAPLRNIKIIPFSEKKKWTLTPMYHLGVDKR